MQVNRLLTLVFLASTAIQGVFGVATLLVIGEKNETNLVTLFENTIKNTWSDGKVTTRKMFVDHEEEDEAVINSTLCGEFSKGKTS